MQVKLVYKRSIGIPTLNRILDAIVEKFDIPFQGTSTLYVHPQLHMDDIFDQLIKFGYFPKYIDQTLIVME